MFDSRAERGGMRVFSPKGASVILLVGALVVVGSLQLGRPTGHVVSDPMSFWEAAGRRLLSPPAVDENGVRDGRPRPPPGGGRPPNPAREPPRRSPGCGVLWAPTVP